jgi:hypothetical protein
MATNVYAILTEASRTGLDDSLRTRVAASGGLAGGKATFTPPYSQMNNTHRRKRPLPAPLDSPWFEGGLGASREMNWRGRFWGWMYYFRQLPLRGNVGAHVRLECTCTENGSREFRR